MLDPVSTQSAQTRQRNYNDATQKYDYPAPKNIPDWAVVSELGPNTVYDTEFEQSEVEFDEGSNLTSSLSTEN